MAQWLLPFLIVTPLYALNFGLEPNADNNNTGFTVSIEDFPAFMRYYGTVFGVGSVVCSCFLLFLYGSMFHATYQHSKMMAKTDTNDVSQNGNKKMFNKAEFRLACMVFVVVIFQFGLALHSVNLCLHVFNAWNVSSEVIRWWNFRIGILVDLFGYSNGYLLLLFSNQMRTQYLKFWCRKQEQTKVVSLNKGNSSMRINRGKRLKPLSKIAGWYLWSVVFQELRHSADNMHI